MWAKKPCFVRLLGLNSLVFPKSEIKADPAKIGFCRNSMKSFEFKFNEPPRLSAVRRKGQATPPGTQGKTQSRFVSRTKVSRTHFYA